VTRHFGSLALGRRVTNQATDIDTNLFSGVDLRAFWETLRLRWWVIPAVLAVSVGLLWAQESDLQKLPSSYLISESYEVRDSAAVLSAVGIDPTFVRPFPDVDNQLLILQSEETRNSLVQKFPELLPVTISRTKPTFSLVSSIEADGQSSFIFRSSGIPTYVFSCSEPERAFCRESIAAYVQFTAQLRKSSVMTGLNELRSILLEAKSGTNDDQVNVKVAAIDSLLKRLETPLLRVSESEIATEATVTTVRRVTFAFGIVAGFLIGFLILLQLTYSDTRIRTSRQVVRLVGSDCYLGTLYKDREVLQDKELALAIRSKMNQLGSTAMRLIPIRTDLNVDSAADVLSTILECPTTVAAPFVDLPVAELIAGSGQELDIVILRKHKDTKVDLQRVTEAFRRSGTPRRFLLLD